MSKSITPTSFLYLSGRGQVGRWISNGCASTPYMNLPLDRKYANLSDREIIDRVITKPHNEEAAAYLLFERYTPKFKKLCFDIYGTCEVYYDCVDDLFLFLKGKNLDWDKLRSFEWRCKFSTWIGITASRRFIEIKPLLIGKIGETLSICLLPSVVTAYVPNAFLEKI